MADREDILARIKFQMERELDEWTGDFRTPVERALRDAYARIDLELTDAPSPAVAEPARKAIDAQGAEECDHDFHYFGDQLVRRCNNCCAIEKTSPLPAATLGKAVNDAARDLDTLAGAIRNAAVKLEICNEDAYLTGPHLLMLIDHIAEAAQQPAASDVQKNAISKLECIQQVYQTVFGVMGDEAFDYIKQVIQSTPAVQADEGEVGIVAPNNEQNDEWLEKLPVGTKLYAHACDHCKGSGEVTDTENVTWPCPRKCKPASPDFWLAVDENGLVNFGSTDRSMANDHINDAIDRECPFKLTLAPVVRATHPASSTAAKGEQKP